MRGILRTIYTDPIHKTTSMIFEVSNPVEAFEIYNKMQEKDIDLTVKRYRERRSLDANSYFHVLVGKIAACLTISKAKAKNIQIGKYGQPEILPDGSPLFYKTTAPADYMSELESIHSIPVKYGEENGKEVIFYKLYRGSHTYNTEEMSYLIDGTVADAKELGIETMTPDELAKMKASWKAHEKAY